MPMSRGQRVQPVLHGDEALTILAQLADRNAELSAVINNLGHRILGLGGVGLRQGTSTYDIAFVRPGSPRIPRSRSKAFATFIAPSHEGTWTPPRTSTLRVGVKVGPSARIQAACGVLQPRAFDRQGGGGWNDIYVHEDGPNADIAFDVVRQAYESFD